MRRSRKTSRRWLWAVVALGLGSVACTTIIGVEDDYYLATSTSGSGGDPQGGTGGTATAGGSGGVGGSGAGGGGGAGGSGASLSCPANSQGPPMVNLGSWCIDATEVTRAHYAAFLATDPTPNQTEPCDGNDDFIPAASWPPGAGEVNLPVVDVDWCDAQAFCAWSGKSLCGRLDGGSTPAMQFDDPSIDQWMRACTQAGTTSYAYSDVYAANQCVDDGYDGVPGYDMASDTALDVASLQGCAGSMSPYTGVFDLSGNVREWQNSCQGQNCRVRGGSHRTPGSATACAADDAQPRTSHGGDIGFRCCSE